MARIFEQYYPDMEANDNADIATVNAILEKWIGFLGDYS